VFTTVLSVPSPTFSALNVATRRFTDSLNLLPVAYWGLKRPELVNDLGDVKILKATEVIRLQMDGQVCGFVAQVEKSGKEVVIGVAVVKSTQDVISTPRQRRRKSTAPPPYPAPADADAHLCAVAHPPSAAAHAPSAAVHPPSAVLAPCRAVIKTSDFSFPEIEAPTDVRSTIHLCRKLASWKESYDECLMSLKDHAENLGFYDQVCFPDEVCFWSILMNENHHQQEKEIYAACGYSNATTLEFRERFTMPDRGCKERRWIDNVLNKIRGREEGFSYSYKPLTVMERRLVSYPLQRNCDLRR
jgi:hypothetical protein